jgi:hypothetical protein
VCGRKQIQCRNLKERYRETKPSLECRIFKGLCKRFWAGFIWHRMGTTRGSYKYSNCTLVIIKHGYSVNFSIQNLLNGVSYIVEITPVTELWREGNSLANCEQIILFGQISLLPYAPPASQTAEITEYLSKILDNFKETLILNTLIQIIRYGYTNIVTGEGRS